MAASEFQHRVTVAVRTVELFIDWHGNSREIAVKEPGQGLETNATSQNHFIFPFKMWFALCESCFPVSGI